MLGNLRGAISLQNQNSGKGDTDVTEQRQQTFPGWHQALIDTSIETLRHYEPKGQPYYGCFSGGKDSCVIKRLAEMAEVNVVWHYNVTTIDPPELVYFIKQEHLDVIFDRPKRSFFTAMVAKGFPTRVGRWCCEEFKESKSPVGARLILGVRAAESPRRAKVWTTFTQNRRKRGEMVNPILYWHDDDVWQFIRDQRLPYCCLYDEGFKRLGCIGCPMTRASGRDRDFARWPGYEKLWKRAFKRLWEKRKGTKQRNGREWSPSARFSSWEELFDWWKSDDPPPKQGECQGGLELWG